MKSVPVWMRPSIGAGITGILAVVAILFLKSGGIIGEGRLRRLLAEENGEIQIAQFMESRPYILPEATLLEAVIKMHQLKVRQIVVINSKKERKLIGLLSMTDIVLEQAEGNFDGEIDISVTPEMSEETETLKN